MHMELRVQKVRSFDPHVGSNLCLSPHQTHLHCTEGLGTLHRRWNKS